MMTAARQGAVRVEGSMPETGGTYYDRQEVRSPADHRVRLDPGKLLGEVGRVVESVAE